jgi:23S rRNA G2069 N7-methylase RlmK/C1962 C5-methylase RlmI
MKQLYEYLGKENENLRLSKNGFTLWILIQRNERTGTFSDTPEI